MLAYFLSVLRQRSPSHSQASLSHCPSLGRSLFFTFLAQPQYMACLRIRNLLLPPPAIPCLASSSHLPSDRVPQTLSESLYFRTPTMTRSLTDNSLFTKSFYLISEIRITRTSTAVDRVTSGLDDTVTSFFSLSNARRECSAAAGLPRAKH